MQAATSTRGEAGKRVVVLGLLAFSLVAGFAASAVAQRAPLMAAAKAGDWSGILRQIGEGTGRIDVDESGPDGTTALHLAVRAREDEVVDALLRAGADANAANRYGITPLSLAAADGNAMLLEALLAAGADPAAAEAVLPESQTLAMLAASTGSTAALEVLAAPGAVDVDARETRTGTTALMWAALDGRADAIRYLASLGADPNLRSRLTDYPHLGNGVLLTPPEEGVTYAGQTPLQNGGWTALMYAARSGAADAIAALAAAGADLDARDPLGESALTLAIINGHWDALRALLDAGADPNIADEAGSTPLYAAVDFHTLPETYGRPAPKPRVVAGSIGAVELLLRAGANPDAALTGSPLRRQYTTGDGRLRAGATPLMRAAAVGDVSMMRLLLEGGADANASAENGNGPLLLAAASAKGVPGAPDYVAVSQAIEAVRLCLDFGADIGAADGSGRTAVHLAATTVGAADMIRFLSGRGADIETKDERGRTPLDLVLAQDSPDEATAALLRSLSSAP